MKLHAYDPEWAFRNNLRARATRWQRQRLLSASQLASIEAAYPLNYSQPAWPLRIGLFVFTLLGLFLAGGFFFLFAHDYPIIEGLLCCTLCFGLLELAISEQRYYHSGVDNALLYAGLSAASTTIFYAFHTHGWYGSWAYQFSFGNSCLTLLLILALLLAALVRYADALVAAAAFGTALWLVALVGMQTALGQAILPFLAMAMAVGTLRLVRAAAQRLAGTHLTDYYANCFLVLKVLGLTVFYLAGNYLIVREGNAELHGLYTSVQVPFAPMFYAFTAGIPLLYIVLGLRRHDRTTLLMGLLAVAFSIFTLRYYRSFMAPEIAAVLAGAVLTLLAGVLLRALRPARFSLTSLPDDEPRHFNLENLIQAQTAHAPGGPAGGFEFGGGESGGGGATGQF